MFLVRHPEEEHNHEATPERLSRVWKAHRIAPSKWYPRSSFHCEGLIKAGTEKKLYLAKRVAEFEPGEFIAPTAYLEDMISAAADPSWHFGRLDDLYSQLVNCIFVVLDEVTNYDQCVVDAAASLLSRLPSRPVELASDPEVPVSQVLESLLLGYFEADTQNPSSPTQHTAKSWNDLVVASKFSANVVRVALLLGQSTKNIPSLRNLRRLADTTADLLEETVQLQRLIVDTGRREASIRGKFEV